MRFRHENDRRKALATMREDLGFIGNNIRRLRRERGWSIAKLASEIGTSDVVLGRIERNVNAPSALFIYRLTEALGVSADALFASGPEKPRRLGFAEGGAPVPVEIGAGGNLPGEVKIMTREVMEGYLALENVCGAQKHAGIPLGMGFDPDPAGIENLAMEARRFMGVEHCASCDCFRLFEDAGFRVVAAPFDRSVDVFSYCDPANRNAFFFVNAKTEAEGRPFGLARELGAVLIFVAEMRAGRIPFPAEGESGAFTARRAAERFGKAFLLPEAAVKGMLARLGLRGRRWSFELIARIARRFGVTAELFLGRLEELDLIEPGIAESVRLASERDRETRGRKKRGGSNRFPGANARLGELVLTARTLEEGKATVGKVEKMLSKWGILYD